MIIKSIYGSKNEINITNQQGLSEYLESILNTLPKYQERAFREVFFENKKRGKSREYGMAKALRILRHPKNSRPLRLFFEEI